jgi:hypothetical protein
MPSKPKVEKIKLKIKIKFKFKFKFFFLKKKLGFVRSPIILVYA